MSEFAKILEKAGDLVRLMDQHPMGAFLFIAVLGLCVAGLYVYKH